jgi:predicted DNA-binding protein with PD1-like motif
MKYFLFITVFILVCISEKAMAQQANARYIKTPTGYLMVLKPGDDLFKELEKFALNENIPAANFTGLGFVNVRFGYFNFKTKKYKPKQFNNMELASMTGTIAWDSAANVSIHAHGVAAGKNFKVRGGHILWAEVGTGTLEVTITVFDRRLPRLKDEKTGANAIRLED